MTEKEKMLAGLPYDPADHTLAADRCRAQTVCRRICLDPSERRRRGRRC